jgi:hypothetical protein
MHDRRDDKQLDQTSELVELYANVHVMNYRRDDKWRDQTSELVELYAINLCAESTNWHSKMPLHLLKPKN